MNLVNDISDTPLDLRSNTNMIILLEVEYEFKCNQKFWKVLFERWFQLFWKSFEVMILVRLERDNLIYICAWDWALKMSKNILLIWVKSKVNHLSRMRKWFEPTTQNLDFAHLIRVIDLSQWFSLKNSMIQVTLTEPKSRI